MIRSFVLAATLAAGFGVAHADAAETLRDFTRDAKSGRAAFTQTVTSPDGARKKVSSGQFEFARPNRFRFAYAKPYEQVIVGDGREVWLYDVDLQQASVRPIDQALGATPAALLAGGALDKDFELQPQPSANGLDWVQATPRAGNGESIGFKSLRVGFKGKVLAAIELVDGFGQRSLLTFSDVATNVAPAPDAFRFTPPAGVQVLRQP